MKLYTEFLNDVMPDVPGCTVDVATHAIRNAVIEFCERSLYLVQDHDPMTIIAGVNDYDFLPPTGYVVTKVMNVFYKSSPMKLLAPDQVGRAELFNRTFSGADTSRQEPNTFYQKDSLTFSVYPIPRVTQIDALTMRVALKPERDSSLIEDVIYEEFAEGIGHGAKARLMMSPNKPYTNAQLAAVELQMFNQAVNVARQRASRGHVRTDLRVEIPRI